MQVTAKVSGLHPATGLYLEAGQPYTINPADFSDEVFAETAPATDTPTAAPAAPEGGTE